jgi:cytochrome c-type biogenesis protein CcmH
VTLLPFLAASAIGLGFLLVPLFRNRNELGASRRSQSIAFYNQQLKELDEDIKKGTIDADGAGATRIEIERRMLGLDGEPGDERRAGDKIIEVSTPSLVLFAVILIGLGSLFYMAMGSPLYRQNWPQAEALDPALQASLDGALTTQVELTAHLQKNPEDGEALFMAVQLASRLGENGRAANLLGQLSRLFPDNVDYLSMQGEALVWHAGGLVTPAARLAFERALTIEPRHPSPRFYQGLWMAQNGRLREALEIWQALRADSADDAPWLANLTAQIARLEQSLGLNPNVAASGLEDISQDMVDEIAALSDEDQAQFINNMIERLRQRLQDNPDDLSGWLRLARAAEVTGDTALAMEALLQAESLAPPQLRGEITARYLELAQGG